MKNTTFLITVVALMVSCSNPQKESKKDEAPKEENTIDETKTGLSNYAVVWEWLTEDEKYVLDNSVVVSQELQTLWKKDIIENVYYDGDAKKDKLGYFPNISFFIKATSKENAKIILDDLTITKKGIAKYTLYPVGSKWYGRNTEKIKENGVTQSFVAVWNTVTKYDDANVDEKIDAIVIKQSEAVAKLYDEGKIENVYFDIEGTQKLNGKTDFVFFVNSKTKEEAAAICESLPFSKNHLASFILMPVGVFWMGNSKD